MHQFNPEEIFEVAQHLMTRSGEGSGRSAASRAYYAAFLMARELAGIRVKTAEVHQRTEAHYERLGEDEIAEGLRDLRRRRNDADYRTERLFSRSDAVEAIKCSRLVRSALRRAAGRAEYARASAG